MGVDVETSHEQHEHHKHEPTLWPPFLALSTILLALGIYFLDGSKNQTNDSNAIIGLVLVGIYILILSVFFLVS